MVAFPACAELDPANNMPKDAAQQMWKDQLQPLSTERKQSSIPKGGTTDSWTYPSPQMFYNGAAAHVARLSLRRLRIRRDGSSSSSGGLRRGSLTAFRLRGNGAPGWSVLPPRRPLSVCLPPICRRSGVSLSPLLYAVHCLYRGSQDRGRGSIPPQRPLAVPGAGTRVGGLALECQPRVPDAWDAQR